VYVIKKLIGASGVAAGLFVILAITDFRTSKVTEVVVPVIRGMWVYTHLGDIINGRM
jgi:membrane associated rhomboid family serine protease